MEAENQSCTQIGLDGTNSLCDQMCTAYATILECLIQPIFLKYSIEKLKSQSFPMRKNKKH